MKTWGDTSASRFYYRSRDHQAKQFAAVLAQIGPLGDRSLLDVGCGYGDLSALLPYNANYLGIDADEDAIETASHLYPHREFACQDTVVPADVIVAVAALQCAVSDPEWLVHDMWTCAREMVVFTTTVKAFSVEEAAGWCHGLAAPTITGSDDDFFTVTLRR